MINRNNHRDAAIKWIQSNEKFREDVDHEFLLGHLNYDEAIERIWRKVQFFGEDYKNKNIVSTSVVGSLDYECQGSLIIMSEIDVKISGYREIQEKVLILRNPDRKS